MRAHPLNAVMSAEDIDRARAWYREKLELEPVVDDELGLEYETGGHRFGLYESENAGTNEATAAGFKVDDVDAAAAQLREKGVAFEEVDLGDTGKTIGGVITAPNGQKAARISVTFYPVWFDLTPGWRDHVRRISPLLCEVF